MEKTIKEVKEYAENVKKAILQAIKNFEVANPEVEIDELDKPEWYILDLESNVGYYSFSQDSERINKLAKVFPLLFYIVADLNM